MCPRILEVGPPGLNIRWQQGQAFDGLGSKDWLRRQEPLLESAWKVLGAPQGFP